MESTGLNIRYHSEYQYSDGELAYQIEGDNESYLSLGHARRLDALPPITINTIYISKTTRERSEKRIGIKKSKTENSTETKHYAERKDGIKDRSYNPKKGDDDILPEDLAEDVPGHTYMVIHSKEILNVLRDIISYHPGCSLLGEDLSIPEPYQILYLHREELRTYESKHPQWHDETYRVECNKHLDVLVEFLDSKYGHAIRDEKNRWTRKVPVCTFEHLWLLYKPGEVGYLNEYKGPYAYITQGFLRGGHIRNTAYSYEIEIWNIDYDGNDVYGETEETINAHNGRNYQQRLVSRGKKFWDLAKEGPCYRQYSGQTATSPFQKVSGRVVIDPLSFFNRSDFETSDIDSDDSSSPTIRDGNHGGDRESYSAGCQCQSCASHSDNVRRGKFVGFNGLWPKSNSPPDDKTFFMLGSFRTFAFVLKRRTWVSLHIENIAEVAEQAYAFEHLVLPEEVKYTLKAISCSYVKEQATSRTQETDIIKCKGEGKISCYMARQARERHCTTAGEVESRLDRYMSLGEEWGAIVLLDEADVYLESRAVSEVKRNSLVSVFLRALEYYKGLLFLTMNRVNTFDEAFRSRIHVALQYRTLSDDNRRKIWENALDRLISDRFTVTQMAWEHVSSHEDVLDLEWNGREIRNGKFPSTASAKRPFAQRSTNRSYHNAALQTAISLADYEAEEEGKDIVTIKRTHLERIVAMSANFQEYIGTLRRNKSDSFVAKKKQLRNDFYQGTPLNGRKLPYRTDEDNIITSRTKMKGRDERRSPDEDDKGNKERASKTRKTISKMSSRANSTNRDSVLRSRSQQPKQRPLRMMTMLDEESEEAASKTRRDTRRPPRSEEDESEQEVLKPKTRSQPMLHLEEEESQEVLAPKSKKPTRKLARDEKAIEERSLKPSGLSRTSTRAASSREEEEDEEEWEQKAPQKISHTTRATRSIYGNARRNASNSRSPAPLKKRMTRTRTATSENEDA